MKQDNVLSLILEHCIERIKKKKRSHRIFPNLCKIRRTIGIQQLPCSIFMQYIVTTVVKEEDISCDLVKPCGTDVILWAQEAQEKNLRPDEHII